MKYARRYRSLGNAAHPKAQPFPTSDQVLAFIQSQKRRISRRQIAQAFNVKAADQPRLWALLRDLPPSTNAHMRKHKTPDRSPGGTEGTMVLVISGAGAESMLLARPAAKRSTRGVIELRSPEDTNIPWPLPTGTRVLAQVWPGEKGHLGQVIRVIGPKISPDDKIIVGLYKAGPGGPRLLLAERRAPASVQIAGKLTDIADGDLVLARASRGSSRAQLLRKLARGNDPANPSLIAIHQEGIPVEFSHDALSELPQLPPVDSSDRTDLRHLPLVTIDGADARDFDDAVFAAPDTDPGNPGGWCAVIAIADVAWYVRPGMALDREACARGTSCYLPDRVIPMLPLSLSGDLCSLIPGADRACLVATLTLDAQGTLTKRQFARALIRSAARLTYEQVQAAIDGATSAVAPGLAETVIAPLHAVFLLLSAQRQRRGTLDLNVVEREVRLAADGSVAAIGARTRTDSHRLIEELMILTNVAVAEELEARRSPLIYRVHDEPDAARMQDLALQLSRLSQGRVVPGSGRAGLCRLLDNAAGRPDAMWINELVLRSQARAVYATNNIGHYGLALDRYAHFTSPIRRYADLVVHRALIRALNLGPGGLEDVQAQRLEVIAQHISMAERRAVATERGAVDRFIAEFYSKRTGQIDSGHVVGATRHALFVRLDSTGAEGILSISALPHDQYTFDERAHSITGCRSGRIFHLGTPVRVRIIRADPLTGSLVLSMNTGKGPTDVRPGSRSSPPGTGRRPMPHPRSR